MILSLFRWKNISATANVRVRLYDYEGNVSYRIYPGYAETDCGDFYPDWDEVDPDTVVPTVDAVEVVRCKDCKKISPSVTAIKGSVWCREFRAYGERRDGE